MIIIPGIFNSRIIVLEKDYKKGNDSIFAHPEIFFNNLFNVNKKFSGCTKIEPLPYDKYAYYTYLSLNSSLEAKFWMFLSFLSMINLTFWKNEAVTAGGCFRSRTSAGSAETMHITWSLHSAVKQHSQSLQSIRPSAIIS